jgi:hypothetical protein
MPNPKFEVMQLLARVSLRLPTKKWCGWDVHLIKRVTSAVVSERCYCCITSLILAPPVRPFNYHFCFLPLIPSSSLASSIITPIERGS